MNISDACTLQINPESIADDQALIVMPDNSVMIAGIGPGVIPQGAPVEDTAGTAGPGDIVKGKTLWVNGELITGTWE